MELLRLGVLLTLALTSLIGCWESGRIDVYTCEDPCGNGQPGTSCDDPCGDCRGQCVPSPAVNFSGPSLLWIGVELEAPVCPPQAPNPVYQGHAGLDASIQCPPCGCTDPACVLPSGLTASDSTCSGGGGALTPFEAPPGWGGSCTSPTPVTSDLLRSLRIGPVRKRPCVPVELDVPHGGLYSPWATFAKGCAGTVAGGRCEDPGLICAPTAEPPPPGFRQCLNYLRDGDPMCPAAYPDKFTFFEGLEDTRACTTCECTPIAQSECLALFTVYSEQTCEAVLLSIQVNDESPSCGDIPTAGADLRSMDASWITNKPGSCVASGGAPTGEAKPLNPSTFCCQPPL